MNNVINPSIYPILFEEIFTLNQKVWAKVTTDAIKSGTNKSPALIIVLGEGTQKVRLLIAELGVIEELVDRV